MPYDPIRDSAPASSASPSHAIHARDSPEVASIRSRVSSGEGIEHLRRASSSSNYGPGVDPRYDGAREAMVHRGRPGSSHSDDRRMSMPSHYDPTMSPRSSAAVSPSMQFRQHPHHTDPRYQPSSIGSDYPPNPPRRGASIHDLITASEIASANQSAARPSLLARSLSHHGDESMESAHSAHGASMSRSGSASSQHLVSSQQYGASSRLERSPRMAHLLNEGSAGAIHDRPRSDSRSSASPSMHSYHPHGYGHAHGHNHGHPHAPHPPHASAASAPPASAAHLGHGLPPREVHLQSRSRPGSSSASASWTQSPPMQAPPLPAVPRTSSSPAMIAAQVGSGTTERPRIYTGPAISSAGHPRSLSASYGYQVMSQSPASGASPSLHASPSHHFAVPEVPSHRSPEARKNMPLPHSPSMAPMASGRAPLTPGSSWPQGQGPPPGAYMDESAPGGGAYAASPRRMSAAHPMASRYGPLTPGSLPPTPGGLPPTPGGLPPTPGSRSLPPHTPGHDPRYPDDYFDRRAVEHPETYGSHHHPHARSFSNASHASASYAEEAAYGADRRASATMRRPSMDISHLTQGSPVVEQVRGSAPPPMPPAASSPSFDALHARRESFPSQELGPSAAAFDPVRGGLEQREQSVLRRPSTGSRERNGSPAIEAGRGRERSMPDRPVHSDPAPHVVEHREVREERARLASGPDGSYKETSARQDFEQDAKAFKKQQSSIKAEHAESVGTKALRARNTPPHSGKVKQGTPPANPRRAEPEEEEQKIERSHDRHDTERSESRSTPVADKAIVSTPSTPASTSMPPPKQQRQSPPEPPAQPKPPQPPALRYAPKKRVSPPKMVMRPISMDEIDQKRRQCRNPLRADWERQTQSDSRGPLDEILAEHHAKRSQQRNGGSNGHGSESVTQAASADSPGLKRKLREEEVLRDANEVADHYNKRREVGVVDREDSPIFGLRKFNNWIKSVMIGQFARGRDPSLDGRARPRRGRILDLGCGKGGDLKKWDKVDPSALVGVDIASLSIEQAKQRHQDGRSRWEAHFFAFDCFSNTLAEGIPRPLLEPMFDSVSLQFCMHYAWENVQKARVMLENVSKYLRRGGTFIGTIPDCEVLWQRLERTRAESGLQDKTFGNRHYKVVFDEPVTQFAPFGTRYMFFLEDAVENVPEYVVDWATFESLASENGLRCIYRRNFAHIYDEESRRPEFGRLLERMRVVDAQTGQLTVDENMWEAVTLYMGFAFEKVR